MTTEEAASHARLCGEWQLRRSVVDARSQERWEGAGRALVSPAANPQLLLLEERLRIGNGERRFDASRVYRLRLDGRSLAVMTGDGTLLAHLADIGSSARSSPYLCGRDRYQLSFDWLAAGGWATRWDVTGAKALTIDSTYTPM